MTATTSPNPPQHLVGKDDLKLVAYIWDCGDDCYCTEPVIAWQWSQRPANGTPKFYRREAIWTGTFVTRDLGLDPDDPDPHEELRAECERRGLTHLLRTEGS